MRTEHRLLLAACSLAAAAPSFAQSGGPYSLTWSTIDGGGVTFASGGVYTLGGTIGQADAGALATGSFGCSGGFWNADGPATCYANCDNSTTLPVLNVNDFVCFQSRFAAADPYADCNHDSSLNVNDFVCFQSAFAAGCP
jgi:hypothetical protein